MIGEGINCLGVCMTPALLQSTLRKDAAVPNVEGNKLRDWLSACGLDVTMGYYPGHWGDASGNGTGLVDQFVRLLEKAFKDDKAFDQGKTCGVHWCPGASVEAEHEVSSAMGS
jgi:hypothetical protein